MDYFLVTVVPRLAVAVAAQEIFLGKFLPDCISHWKICILYHRLNTFLGVCPKCDSI